MVYKSYNSKILYKHLPIFFLKFLYFFRYRSQGELVGLHVLIKFELLLIIA